MNWIQKETELIKSRLIQMRRDLHKIPEFGEILPKTKAYVKSVLDEFNIDYTENPNDSGIIANIKGRQDGKIIILRADMDAIHGTEETEFDFKSEIDGCMHGCGHDAHTATLLCVGIILSKNKDKFNGTVRLVFQTAEEIGSGAKRMMEQNVFNGVSASLGLHVGNLTGNDTPTGAIVIKKGYVSAGKTKFIITVKGKATHSAFPALGIDSILIGARIVNGLEELSAREIPVGQNAVISVGSFHAGEDHNTIPAIATISGSIRCQDDDFRNTLGNRVVEVAKGICSAFRADCDVKIWTSSISVNNDATMCEFMANSCQKVLDSAEILTQTSAPLMASDDFCYYAKQVPSVYFFLHTNNPQKGYVHSNHSPYFAIDEDVLYKGVLAYLVTATDFLNQ